MKEVSEAAKAEKAKGYKEVSEVAKKELAPGKTFSPDTEIAPGYKTITIQRIEQAPEPERTIKVEPVTEEVVVERLAIYPITEVTRGDADPTTIKVRRIPNITQDHRKMVFKGLAKSLVKVPFVDVLAELMGEAKAKGFTVSLDGKRKDGTYYLELSKDGKPVASRLTVNAARKRINR